MKIEKIDIDGVRVRKGSSWVFVQIHTEEGLVGLGEFNPSAPREECISELRRMGTYALGKDPRHIEAFVAGLEPAALGRCGVHALAAFEQALWDILGQSLGVPVYQLLGGKGRDEQRLYANITRATDGLEPEGFVKSAKGARSRMALTRGRSRPLHWGKTPGSRRHTKRTKTQNHTCQAFALPRHAGQA